MNIEIKKAYITQYRIAIQKRYDFDFLQSQSYNELTRLAPDKIKELCNFFLENVYPSFESRELRDIALESLAGILKTPSKLWPLMKGLTFKSLGILGKDTLYTLQIALTVIATYLNSLKIEEVLFAKAEKLKINPEEMSELTLQKLIASIDSKEMLLFLDRTLSLFHSISDSRVIIKAITLMEEAQKIMAQNSKYSDQERRGLDFGLNLLRQGNEMFFSLSEDETKLVLRGIELVERDWYRQCCSL